MEQPTKDQHFVPKFYLKRFSDAHGTIKVLNLAEKRVIKSKRYSSVCYGRYFYATEAGQQDSTSQEFERMFGDIENEISKDWDGMITRAVNKVLQPNDFSILSQFVAMLMLRTKANRDNLQVINIHFLNFILGNLQGFTNIIYSQEWTVYNRTGEFRFITSENPVVEWSPKQTGFWGAPRLSQQQYIAVSPDVLIELTPPPLPEPGDDFPISPPPSETVQYKEISDDDVLMYDCLLTGHGSAFAYSQERRELDELNNQYSTRGVAFQLFDKNFLRR